MFLKNLSIGYPNRVVAAGINLRLEAGMLTCLIGENGVGKSTLLRTMAGFQKPLAGEIVIDGVSVSSLAPKRQARLISVVLTDKPNVQNTTVRELVAMGRMPYTGFFGRLSKEDEAVVDDCMKIVGVEPGRKVGSLSDGERQKAMIARALAQQAPYIFLDEPTAFLDYPSKLRTMQLLKSLAREHHKTILLSTHDIEIALAQADRLIMMEKPSAISHQPASCARAFHARVSLKYGTPKIKPYEKAISFTADALVAEL